MSGHADDGTVQDAVGEAGGVFMAKPVTLEALAGKVREALAD